MHSPRAANGGIGGADINSPTPKRAGEVTHLDLQRNRFQSPAAIDGLCAKFTSLVSLNLAHNLFTRLVVVDPPGESTAAEWPSERKISETF